MHQKLSYNKGIDGLRAIAILFVIFYHAGFSLFSGGFIGVDVFFVLSGYLITHHICDELYEKKSFSFGNFYARRVKRLVPAILFLVLTTIVLWGIFCAGVPWDTKLFVDSVRYSVFGLANIFFQKNTGGYFDTASDELPLLHFWSLAVEEQFYLIWPLLLFTIYKTLGFINIKRILALVIAASFAGTLYLINDKHSGAFYWMPARAWELACGGLLVFLIPKISFKEKWYPILTILSFITLGFCALTYTHSTTFPGITALPPVLATMGLVISLTKSQSGINKFLEHKFFLRIGLLSYGLYLWHWPLFSMAKINGLHSHGLFIILIILSFILSEVSLRWVENPIRFGAKIKDIKPRYVISSALVLCFLLMNGAKILPQVDSLYATESNKFLSQMKENHPFKKNCHDQPQNLGTELCTKDYSDNHSVHLFVWGNSHAAPFAAFFDKLAQDEKWKISYGSAGHYAGLLHPTKLILDSDFGREKMLTHQKMYELIVNEKGRKVVALSNRYLRHFKDQKVVTKEALNYTIELLQKATVDKIIITLPGVEFPIEPDICLRRKMDCSIDKKVVEEERREVVEYLNQMAKQYSNITLVDPLPVICPGDKCELSLNGFPVNQDDDHMSLEASRYLYQEIVKQKGRDYLSGF